MPAPRARRARALSLRLSAAAAALFLSAATSSASTASPPRVGGDAADDVHNAPEAWRALFSSVAPPPGGGARALQSPGASSTVNFSLPVIAHGGNVTVAAQVDPSLVSSPSWTSYRNTVYVALYTARQPGATIDLNGSTPVRFQAAMADPRFANSGAASFRFAPYNLHSGGYFAYLIAGGLASAAAAPTSPQATWVAGGAKPWTSLTGQNGSRPGAFAGTVLAISAQPLAFSAPNEATMLRVTPGAFAGELRVTWAHAVGTTGGVVSYSRRADMSGALTAAAAAPTTLTTDDVCALGPAATTGFRDFGAQFTASLDLRAFSGSTVYYTVGAADNGATTSAVMALRVPLLPGVFDGRPQLWLSWADQGVGYADDSYPGRDYNNGVIALATAAALARDVAAAAGAPTAGMSLQGLTVAGDATYADGYETVWEDYFSMMSSTIPTSPYLISGGNVSPRSEDTRRRRALSAPTLPRSPPHPPSARARLGCWPTVRLALRPHALGILLVDGRRRRRGQQHLVRRRVRPRVQAASLGRSHARRTVLFVRRRPHDRPLHLERARPGRGQPTGHVAARGARRC